MIVGLFATALNVFQLEIPVERSGNGRASLEHSQWESFAQLLCIKIIQFFLASLCSKFSNQKSSLFALFNFSDGNHVNGLIMPDNAFAWINQMAS